MKKQFLIFILGVLSFFACQAQSRIGVQDFDIQIKMTKTDVVMSCTRGCSWVNLSYTKPLSGKSQWIDENGMVGDLSQGSTSHLLFSLSYEGAEVRLVSKHGTYWKELNFTLSENQAINIDQNGMKGSVQKI